MKINKIIKIVTIILLITVMTIASVFGIYKLKNYKVRNIVPEYLLGMEFTKSRVIDLAVDTTVETTIYDKDGNEITKKEEGVEYTEENGYRIEENKANSDDVLTSQNYKKTKSILKNRLKKFGVDQFRVNLDESNGNLQIRIPENEDTDTVIDNLLQSGTFELKASETQEVLIDTNKVKSADVVYSQGEAQTAVFIQIKFNKEGKQKLDEISKIYGTTAETANEESETEETAETKSLKLYLNGQAVTEVDPKQSVMNEMLYIGVGAGNDAKTLEQYRVMAEETVSILNSGILPIKYTETDYTEIANITEQQKNIAMYVIIAIVAIMIVIFIIKLKTNGILASVLQIGYIALLLLALRYTNVKITVEGIFGILVATILNYIYIYKAFKNIELNFVKDITKKYALKLIPVYVIAIILSFNSIANIYSIGMTLVWGIIVMYLYNLILTKIALDTIKE